MGLLELAEGLLDLLTQLGKVCLDDLLALGRQLELHGGDLVDEVVEAGLDDGERDLVVGLRRALDCALAEVVEEDDVFQHAAGLVEGAEAVVVGEAVLLQKVLTEDLGDLQDDLVRLGERILCVRARERAR